MLTPDASELSTYTPMVAERPGGFRGRAHHVWPLCSSTDDPRLGLRHEQLAKSLTGLIGEAELSQTMSAELAAATHALLSHRLGAATGGRTTNGGWIGAVVEAATAQTLLLPTPFAEYAAEVSARRAAGEQLAGYGGTRGPIRRAIEASPFTHVHNPNARGGWSQLAVNDFAPLDVAWGEAVRASSGGTVLPLLDTRVLCCFFPARRALPNYRIPSVWEIFAVTIRLGPGEWNARATQHIENEIVRGINVRTLITLVGKLNALTHTMAKIAHLFEVTSPWVNAPRIQLTASQKQRAAARTYRTAPSLARVRHARAALRRRYERAAVAREKLPPFETLGQWTHSGLYQVILQLLLLELDAQTSARVVELAGLRRPHYDPAHQFPDGRVGPGILFMPAKGVDVGATWRAIHPLTAELLEVWLAHWDGGPTAPLFPASAERPHEVSTSSQLTRSFSGMGRNKVAIAHPGRSTGYGLGEIRHLVEQLAHRVGLAMAEASSGVADRQDPQVLPDALLGHVMQERHAYKDLEASRGLLAARAALGDPVLGVPGVVDLVMEGAGARTVWDLGKIRSALSAIDHARDLEASARQRLDYAEVEVARITREIAALPPIDWEVKPASVDEAVLIMFDRQERVGRREDLVIQREQAREARHLALQDRTHAEGMLDQGRSALVLAEAQGRTQVLDDLEPLEDQSRERESFATAVDRVRGTISSLELDRLCGPLEQPDGLMRVRECLNVAEFAALYATVPRSANRWLDGSRRAPVELRHALVHLGDRRRFVAIELLPADWYGRLSLSQVEMLEQLLRIPMGATRWGGVVADRDALEAGVAALRASRGL